MNAHYSFTITVLVRRNRANASGEVPIYIRVIVDGKPSEIAAKQYVKPDLWNPERGRVKGNTEYARTVNTLLDNSKTKLTKIFNRLEEQGEGISAEQIKNLYLGKASKQRTLLEMFDYHKKLDGRVEHASYGRVAFSGIVSGSWGVHKSGAQCC